MSDGQGINSFEVNASDINGGYNPVVTTNVESFFWISSTVTPDSVLTENVQDECVLVDFQSTEDRTAYLPSRQSTRCS